jgi:hypothetical protein
MDMSGRLQSTVGEMYSILIGCGSVTNYFVANCRMPSFRRARQTLLSSLKLGATQNRTYWSDVRCYGRMMLAPWMVKVSCPQLLSLPRSLLKHCVLSGSFILVVPENIYANSR